MTALPLLLVAGAAALMALGITRHEAHIARARAPRKERP